MRSEVHSTYWLAWQGRPSGWASLSLCILEFVMHSLLIAPSSRDGESCTCIHRTDPEVWSMQLTSFWFDAWIVSCIPAASRFAGRRGKAACTAVIAALWPSWLTGKQYDIFSQLFSAIYENLLSVDDACLGFCIHFFLMEPSTCLLQSTSCNQVT